MPLTRFSALSWTLASAPLGRLTASKSPSRIVPVTPDTCDCKPVSALAVAVLPSACAATAMAETSCARVALALSAALGLATLSSLCSAFKYAPRLTLPCASPFQSATLTLRFEPSRLPNRALSSAPRVESTLARRGPMVTQAPTWQAADAALGNSRPMDSSRGNNREAMKRFVMIFPLIFRTRFRRTYSATGYTHPCPYSLPRQDPCP